jgi:RND family efflux transporter, MFP subunit
MKKKKFKIWGTISVIVILAVVLGIFIIYKEDVRLNTTTVGTGSLDITVMATGYIQPVEEIKVGTQVSGVIEKIYVDYNSHVKKGQLLAELDKLTLKEKLNQANAQVNSSKSDLEHAWQNYRRIKKLHESKAATEVALEDANNKLTQAETSLVNARATLGQAQVNLSYAYIYSPIDGVILDRAVNTGQTVAASFSTPTLFTIAEDLTKMQVEADVDEADIGQVVIGQKVGFTVDAYAGEVFEGTVTQIRIQPKVTSNVVTYTVIVDAPNPEEKLFPGMTANITIAVDAGEGNLVPVEAINFKMNAELMKRLEIDESTVKVNTKSEQYVWIKTGDKLEQRLVKTGSNDGINYVVLSGLDAGEEVLLSASIGKKGRL